MSDEITYLHLEPEAALPEIADAPTRMVVIVVAAVSPEWQTLVSDWIVRSGCRYMMAWGVDCSSWDDSVDWANIDKYGDVPIPEDGCVVTTWHSDEPLEEVFWYSKNVAVHPLVDLHRTIILDISPENRSGQLLGTYASA